MLTANRSWKSPETDSPLESPERARLADNMNSDFKLPEWWENTFLSLEAPEFMVIGYGSLRQHPASPIYKMGFIQAHPSLPVSVTTVLQGPNITVCVKIQSTFARLTLFLSVACGTHKLFFSSWNSDSNFQLLHNFTALSSSFGFCFVLLCSMITGSRVLISSHSVASMANLENLSHIFC